MLLFKLQTKTIESYGLNPGLRIQINKHICVFNNSLNEGHHPSFACRVPSVWKNIILDIQSNDEENNDNYHRGVLHINCLNEVYYIKIMI